MKSLLPCLALVTLLGGCASPTGVVIDDRHVSHNQDSRVLFLVLHYTVADTEASLKILTQPSEAPVSSHYLVSDAPVKTYRLVDESRRAWHAGPSSWRGHAGLNASSIGIEIVNPGGSRQPDGQWDFKPFPPAQIAEVVALCREIVARHQIRPERIVGHGEIQPGTKVDPGPLFPWKALADAGLIGWPEAQRVAERQARYAAQLPDADWVRRKLVEHGFAPQQGETPEAVETLTRDQLVAFQMRYRPARYDGVVDAETAALLDVVTQPDGLRFTVPTP